MSDIPIQSIGSYLNVSAEYVQNHIGQWKTDAERNGITLHEELRNVKQRMREQSRAAISELANMYQDFE